MLNRKIGIAAVAMFLLTLPVVAFATTTRLEGMSLPGDYTSDFTSIYGWPSSLTGVGNLVYGELGNDLSPKGYPAKQWQGWERSMGAVLPGLWNGKYGAWAIHLREQTPGLGQGDNTSGTNAGNSGFDPNTNTNQAFDIMWAKKFGTSSLGIQMNRSYNELTDEIPGTTWTFKQDFAANEAAGVGSNLYRNIMGYGAGWSMEMNPNTTADFSLLYQKRTFENSQTNVNKYSDDGGSNYSVGFRAMHKCTPNMTVVPVVKFYSYDLSTQSTVGAATTSASNTLKGWQLGAAGNWTIGSNDLFVLGATLAQNTLDEESNVLGVVGTANGYAIGGAFNPKLKATETVMPEIFMALETHVNPWLTLRLGATKGTFNTLKIEGSTGVANTSQTITLKGSPFAMNTGASVKLGTLTFDTLLDNLFFTNPFAQLMGSSNANFWYAEVFPKVSVSYRW